MQTSLSTTECEQSLRQGCSPDENDKTSSTRGGDLVLFMFSVFVPVCCRFSLSLSPFLSISVCLLRLCLLLLGLTVHVALFNQMYLLCLLSELIDMTLARTAVRSDRPASSFFLQRWQNVQPEVVLKFTVSCLWSCKCDSMASVAVYIERFVDVQSNYYVSCFL